MWRLRGASNCQPPRAKASLACFCFFPPTSHHLRGPVSHGADACTCAFDPVFHAQLELTSCVERKDLKHQLVDNASTLLNLRLSSVPVQRTSDNRSSDTVMRRKMRRQTKQCDWVVGVEIMVVQLSNNRLGPRAILDGFPTSY